MAYSQAIIAAVMTELVQGVSYNKISKKHGVSRATIAKWAKKANHKLPTATNIDVETVVENISSRLWALQGERLEAQGKLIELIHDKEWLKRQDAAGIARLAEVFDDKTTRALGLLASGTPQDAADSAPDG